MLCGPKNLARYPDTILRLDLRVLRLEFFFILLKDSDDRAARQRCSQENIEQNLQENNQAEMRFH